MGESRYFTAHGAQPHDGQGWDGRAADRHPSDGWQADRWAPQAWAADHGAPEYDAAAQWPAHAAPGPDLYADPAPLSQSAHAPVARSGAWSSQGHHGPEHVAQGRHGYEPPLHRPAAQPVWQGSSAHPPMGAAPQAPYAAPVPDRTSVPPVSVAGLAQGLGAVLSLALMVGGGVWAWQMMQRDVSGVPVVRALEGPLRVAPADPGGTQAAHQGLSVNELAADGASGLPEEIVLAPAPLDLTEDIARPAGDTRAQNNEEMLIEVGLPAPGGDAAPNADGAALGFVSPNRSAVTRSPRPVTRNPQLARPVAPAAVERDDMALAAAVANSVAADLSRSGGVDVDPASIGPGTRLVQLGAYDTAAEARSAWDGLVQRFSPLLDDRGRVIEAAHSGGSVFYRLRAHGFSDERDARRFCAALIDQRLDCIPVLIR